MIRISRVDLTEAVIHTRSTSIFLQLSTQKQGCLVSQRNILEELALLLFVKGVRRVCEESTKEAGNTRLQILLQHTCS